MSESVTVPSLMMMILIVSEESLVRDTHIQTDRQTRVAYSNICKVAYNFANN